MTAFFVLLLLLSPPVVEVMIHARRARARAAAPPLLGHGAGPSEVRPGAGTEDVPAWSALDDHQLTRLLMSSANS